MGNNLINLSENTDNDTALKEMREKIEKKRSDLKKMETELREKERKKRTHELIEVGAIAAKAGISRYDKNLLLGAFTFIANEVKNSSYTAQEWTETGASIFQADLDKKMAAAK